MSEKTPKQIFEEWAQLKGDFGLLADISHSALLDRLLSGKAALPTPPPKSFSYPWYALIENGRDDNCEVAIWTEGGERRIYINQSNQFRLLQEGVDQHRVEYDGVEYRVWRTKPDRDWGWSIERVAEARSPRDPEA